MDTYFRADGTRVVNYKRGKGAKPRENRSKPVRTLEGNMDYSVTLIFGKDTETHRVSSDSLPGAAYGGLQSQLKAEIPSAMRIREAKR